MKKHLYESTTTNNDLITQYMDGADAVISSYIHSDYDDTNQALEQAKFLLVSSWFAYRENEVTLNFTELPFGVKNILDMQMSVSI